MMRRVKRFLDVFVAGVALIVLSPLIAVVSLLVLASVGWPIVFAQMRPGLGGRPFHMYKFRTMTNENDASGLLLSDEARLTTIGLFLRSMSLDELPEFVNVLIGDMSLVGPRPLLMQYLSRYTPEQARRHEVVPGITGWAQVNGRNAISWEEKFNLDVWYVDHWSLWLDAQILALTAAKVFRREGITAEGNATAPEFRGSKKLAE